MHDFVYRYTCKGCGAILEAVTLRGRGLTDAQKKACQKGILSDLRAKEDNERGKMKDLCIVSAKKTSPFRARMNWRLDVVRGYIENQKRKP